MCWIMYSKAKAKENMNYNRRKTIGFKAEIS